MYRILRIFFLIICGECGKQDLIFMSTTELISYWGYKAESHTVTTEDGYILTVHRIPNSNSTHYPVLIQHGLLMASDSWVLRGPGHDLVFLLAEQGFDIWLANTRGNYYSKRHIAFRNVQKRFWNYGWNELGMFDIPAMINHIKKVTNREKIIHIGHSMGTTSFYTMLCKRPEMNENVLAHISLAPVVYVHRMKMAEIFRPIVLLVNKFLLKFQDWIRKYDFFSRDFQLSKLLVKTCNISIKNKYLCYRIVFYFTGFDFVQFKEEYFDRFLGHFPSGASSGMILHYAQNILSKEFREFDYGRTLNIEKYGNPLPPRYNLTRIAAPVYLYYSTNDYLSHSLDVERLAEKLPNVKKKYLVPYKYFNHLDYIWARDSKKLLFNDIIETVKTFPGVSLT